MDEEELINTDSNNDGVSDYQHITENTDPFSE